MNLYQEVSFETKVFEKLQVAVQYALSRQMMAGVRPEHMDHIINDMAQSMVYRLRAHVWHDPDRQYKKVHKITYTQAHPTWKHALVASLPEGSFRRRWCHFFWDIPLDYRNTLVTERVEVDAKTLFPENTMQYPDSLGRAHVVVHMNPLGATYEPYYN